MAGNLNIIGDIGIDSESTKPEVTRRLKEEFKQREAVIILHLFKQEFEKISCSALVTREPQDGRPVEVLRVEYDKDKAEKVDPALRDLQRKIKSVEYKSVEVPEDRKQELAEFVNEYKANTEILLLPDIVGNLVEVVGKSYKPVEDAVHKLKLKLRVLQTSSSRTNRKSSEPSADKPSYSSIVATGRKEDRFKDSNIDKYRKGKRSFDNSYSSPSNNGSFSSSTYGASSSDDFKFETELQNGFILKVYKASITSLNVDVIVNAANDSMMHGGGVARVISDAAGYDLDRESAHHVQTRGTVGVKENIVTTAGKLPYDAVIHAVGPVWHDYRDKIRCLDDLEDCVYNILDTCKKRSYSTVAMSAISAGIFAVPKELCADMYVHAADNFSKTLSSSECPTELHIIDVDTRILHLVKESVKRWKQDPHSLEQRITIPKYLEENPQHVSNSSYNSGGHRSRGSYRSPRHGNGGQNSGANSRDGIHGNEPRPNLDEQIDEGLLKCGVSRMKDEKFRWGGTAKIFILDTQITVKIFTGEINKVRNMDAIVCSTGPDLKARGFIAEALKKAGGYDYTSSYDKMVQKHSKQVEISNVFKCEGGKLGTKYVLHAVVSRIVEADTREIQAYQKCMEKILKKAFRNRFESLSIPLLGTGTIQTNRRKLKLCGTALLKALEAYLEKHGDKNEIREIHLINNKKEVTDALEEVFSVAVGCHVNSDSTKSRNKDQGRYSSSKRGEGHAGARQHNTAQKSEGRRTYSSSGANDEFNDDKEKGQFERSTGGPSQDSDGSESDHYDTIEDPPATPLPAKQPDAKKPTEPQGQGNLMIIES